MKPEWRRFAPIGLYIAGAAALAAFVLVMLQREFTLAVQISLGLIVVGLAVFILLDPDHVRRMLTGRQARYGSNALLLAVAFVGILAILNWLAFQNTKRWDLTEDQVNTLAAETLATLKALEQPVAAKAFYTSQAPTDQAEQLLRQYAFYSDGKFTYEFIDPYADPLAAEAAQVTKDASIVLFMGDQKEPVSFASEQELTGALVRLQNPEQRAVYFIGGHGEYSPEEAGDQSYSQAKATLESKNYTVKMLNLLADNQMPTDASVIVIAGPQKPVSAAEVELLKQFVAAGGALVVMEEPTVVSQFGGEADPLADYLAGEWGIVLGDDLVIDQSSNQPTFAIGSQWGSHSIVTSLSGYVSVMPTARSVSIAAAPEGASQQTLVSTAPQAWAETDLTGLLNQQQPGFDGSVDMAGPVPVGAVGENFQSQGRVVVFGDADFASNPFFTAYGNGDLFVNATDWAAGNESMISLTPKNNTQRVVVPPEAIWMNLLFLAVVILLPVSALVAGVVVWIQRRRRG